MASKEPELKFQPNEEPGVYGDTRKPDIAKPSLETIPGGHSSGASGNEYLAAGRTKDIELKIKSLENSSKRKSPEEQSNLDATRLEILSKQLPHARGLQSNLSAMRGLETEIDGVLKSMQGIIAPEEKSMLSFVELLDAWAHTPDEKLGHELSKKLTMELNELNIRYGQLNAEYQERYNMHLETQNRLAELQDSLEEVEALKQEVVDDITSRINVRTKGGSLIAESSSAMFDQIGTHLKEYKSALDDEQQNLVDELSKLEESIPLLEEEAKNHGAGEWFKQLFKKTSERGYAKDRLADARAKKRETLKNLERLILIQRALGFASGHVGVTPAGLSNLESRLELTAGAGMIAPASHKNAPQTFARRLAMTGESIADKSFEFSQVSLMKEIQKKAEEQEKKKIKPLSDEEASYLRSLKTKKSPATQEPAIPEIPATDILEEDSIPMIPIAEKPVPQTEGKTAKILPVEEWTPVLKRKEQQKVEELRGESAQEKAIAINNYILANINIASDTTPEAVAFGFERKVSNYINLVISPEEAPTVLWELRGVFDETIKEADKNSAANLLQQRFKFAEQRLLERAKGAPANNNIELTSKDPLDQEDEGSTSAETEPSQDTAPLRVEHKTPQKSVSERKILTSEEESAFSPLGVLMADLNSKRLKPIFTAFNTRKIPYETALKQAIAETDRAIQSLSKEERKQLSQMYNEMIGDLKETSTSKGKNLPPATERLLKEIAKRMDPDWKEPTKPTGKWRKWIAGILGTAAIGGAVSETIKRAEQNEKSVSASTHTEEDNMVDEQGQPELVAPPFASEMPQETRGAASVASLGVPETRAPKINVETPASPATSKQKETTRPRMEHRQKSIVRGTEVTKPTKPKAETVIPPDTDPKGPERNVDTRYIHNISAMGRLEQSLLKDFGIAFKKLYGQPRLVKARNYTGADSQGQEKALHAFEASAKKIRDDVDAPSMDRERASNILAAIQHSRMEGLD